MGRLVGRLGQHAVAAGLNVLLVCASAGASESAYQFTLGKLLAEQGDYEEAVESFSRAAELAPDDTYVRIEYARLLLRLGRAEEAAEQADVAYELGPGNLDALRVYSRTYLRLAERDGEALQRARDALELMRARAPSDAESLTALGQIYLGESKFGKAIEVFEQIVDLHPRDRVAFSLLVDALLRSGQDARAEEAVRALLDIDPRSVRARIALAELLTKRGDHRGAADLLSAAAGEAPRNLEIRRRLGLELYRSGDLEGALEMLEEVLEDEPGGFGTRYLKALIVATLGRDEEALALLETLHREQPENVDLTLLLARVLERQGGATRAMELLASSAERLDAAGEVRGARSMRLELASLHARGEDWASVVAAIEPLLATAGGGERVDLLMLYAGALVQLGRGEEALPLLDPAGLKGVDADRLRAKQAEVLFELGRERQAVDAMVALAETGTIERLSLAAEVLQRYERYEEAVPLLENALELQPESRQLLFWYGSSQERAGRKAVAGATFERLLELEPDFAPALNYLGYMWAEEGQNLDRALALVRQAVELEPDNGAYADSLGWAHFQLGQYEEARTHLERAVGLIGEDAVVFEHLGDLYVVLGEHETAKDFYSRAIAMQEDNEGLVRRKLERLTQSQHLD